MSIEMIFRLLCRDVLNTLHVNGAALQLSVQSHYQLSACEQRRSSALCPHRQLSVQRQAAQAPCMFVEMLSSLHVHRDAMLVSSL